MSVSQTNNHQKTLTKDHKTVRKTPKTAKEWSSYLQWFREEYAPAHDLTYTQAEEFAVLVKELAKTGTYAAA